MAIAALPLEQIITEAVLQGLDSPGLHDALASRVGDDQPANALNEQIAADTAQLDELAQLHTDREITAPEWVQARKSIEARSETTRHRHSGLSGTRHLDPYIGNGAGLRQQWDTLNLDRQRAIVKGLVDHVQILPRRQRQSSRQHRARPPGLAPLGGTAPGPCSRCACARGPGIRVAQQHLHLRQRHLTSDLHRHPLLRARPRHHRGHPLDPPPRVHGHCTHTAGGPCHSGTSSEDHCTAGQPAINSEAPRPSARP